jgi:hypothetical protein
LKRGHRNVASQRKDVLKNVIARYIETDVPVKCLNEFGVFGLLRVALRDAAVVAEEE